MLLSAVCLAAGTALLELSIWLKVPAIRQMIERYEWSGIVLSAALALALGHVFGAVGTTVLIGGVLSMILTQPFYYYVNRGRGQILAKHKELTAWWQAGSSRGLAPQS